MFALTKKPPAGGLVIVAASASCECLPEAWKNVLIGGMPDRPIIHGVMHFANAMLGAGVLTDRVVVMLPPREWWTLYTALDRELGRYVVYDGRGALEGSFKLCGVRFERREADRTFPITHRIVT